MYRCDESGLIEYETADEIMNSDITHAWEDSENYYFKIDSGDAYDETIWVVNKNSHSVSQMDFIDFRWEKKTAKEISVDDVKKRFA